MYLEVQNTQSRTEKKKTFCKPTATGDRSELIGVLRARSGGAVSTRG